MDSNSAKVEQKKLKQCIEFILQECRMVLPGIQALFGFQLIAVFNQRFMELSVANRYVHLLSIIFTVISVALLMGPAAYHRQNLPRGIPPELCTIGTNLVQSGMFTLMISISLEIYLVTTMVSSNFEASITCGIASFAMLSAVWFIYPWLNRSQDKSELISFGDMEEEPQTAKA